MKYLLAFILLLLPSVTIGATQAEIMAELRANYTIVGDPQRIKTIPIGNDQIVEYELKLYTVTDNLVTEETIRVFVRSNGQAFYARFLPIKLRPVEPVQPVTP